MSTVVDALERSLIPARLSTGEYMPHEALVLLRKWKQAQGITTDAEAARKLGITRGAISNWRMRGSTPEPLLILRMCNDLNDDFAEWVRRTSNAA